MAKKERSGMWIIIGLVLAMCASAVQQTVVQGDVELEIVYPDREFVRLGDVVYFNFLVVNSTGAALNASAGEVVCTYGIENSSGSVLIENLTGNNNPHVFFPIITDHITKYQYAVWCESVYGEHGFLANHYFVTQTGIDEPGEGRLISVFLGLLPLFLAIIFLIGAATLGEDHNVLRIGLFLFSPAFVIASMHWLTLALIKFFYFPELQEAIGSGLYWMVIVWGVIITYFIIYGIYKAIHVAAQKKDERLNY